MQYEIHNGLVLIFAATIIMIASGLPACFFDRRFVWTQRLTTALMLIGSVLGWWGLVVASFGTPASSIVWDWHLPAGHFSIGLDALGAVFLIPVFTIPVLGSFYGLSYWRQSEHPENGRGLGLFYGLLAGGMALVVLSRDSVLFLIAWELMAMAAFFLAGAEDEKAEVRRAGWTYLVATHAGTICLLALFALLRQVSGGFALSTVVDGSLTTGIAATLFVLTIIGFGFKAGLMPLHVWLPGAHANAPSHVSAVMSGVMLKMGIYGILRVLTLLPVTELWNGEVVLGLGAITGILGIVFAIAQNDIKRLMAYSSIENIGIITMGIGLALIGRALHRADFVLLGLGGALLHVWNHSLFKSLIFLNSGAIMHAVHTRDMNRMGGLAKSMPVTAGLFLFGAVAICGLPPLNGFASEWLIYLGLFHSVGAGSSTVWPVGVAAVALAVIGALALACFVKIYCVVFLGTPRHPVHGQPHDPSRLMRYPMMLLAGGCVVLGILPQLGFPLLQNAVEQWMDPVAPAIPQLASAAPFQWISSMAMVFIVLVVGGFVLLRRKIVRQAPALVGTWGCGYGLATPRIQYTATSFGEMLVSLFRWVLFPRFRRPAISSVFPAKSEFSTEVPDPVLERVILPAFRQAGRNMMKLRLLQQGRIQIYLLYVLAVLVFLLGWGKLGF
ncbi:proton-conducting transporter transmembrane domain-containing protein [Pontiella sulfatireligans]|uniref:Hydrogenase-4 component B n=1 Tax=Pontiella sulfatireligans TaxID=2750658 RepID=A0A6C2UMT2_9BACT|nr:proton-conducting transporter membrane subunit [Pontiella sulfatireligans]VGO20614.1 Hydrogenase-4 component B [Pontiella sulfatireligans]